MSGTSWPIFAAVVAGCASPPAAAPSSAHSIEGKLLSLSVSEALPDSVTLGGAINTDVDGDCTILSQGDGAPDVCVVTAVSIDVASPLRPFGSRPLALVGFTNVSVRAAIDLTAGAGANSGPCVGATPGVTPTLGGTPGGGGGGGFGGQGGNGSEGGNNTGSGEPGAAESWIRFVRAGCNGAAGAPAFGSTSAAGGIAGGGLYVLAGDSIEVGTAAVIAASGSGGGGGAYMAGGGGGASGGFVGFDAPIVSIAGVVFASGGGGGAGGYMSEWDGGPGEAGETGTLTEALGGLNPHQCGGGNGGVGDVAAQSANVGCTAGAQEAGGGGGGSVGVIWIHAYTKLITGTISPEPIDP